MVKNEFDVSGLKFEKFKTAMEREKVVVDISSCLHYGSLLDEVYKRVIRPSIIQPTFLTHYPAEMIALAKRNKEDSRKINSVQLIVDGAEVFKAYDELNDPIDQKDRFEEQVALMKKGDNESMPMDEDFVDALMYGMPPTAGFGMGIDRLAMILAGVDSVRDVILFPFMRLEGAKEGKSKETKVAVAVLNKDAKLEKWQEINAASHLSAAFAARKSRELFLYDTVKTKDGVDIKLNVQHAIMIKYASSNEDVLDLIKRAKGKGLEISEFTREMLDVTDDRKVAKMTSEKDLKDVEYIGALVFGKKSVVDSLTEKFELIE